MTLFSEVMKYFIKYIFNLEFILLRKIYLIYKFIMNVITVKNRSVACVRSWTQVFNREGRTGTRAL